MFYFDSVRPPNHKRCTARCSPRALGRGLALVLLLVCFLSSVDPLATSAASTRVALWEERISTHPTATSMALKPQEELPPGADTKWTEWKCLNRLRTGVGCSKVSLQKWGYLDTAEDVTCDCRTAPQTMQHLLQCPVLEQVCTADDLAVYNENAQKCVQQWLDRALISTRISESIRAVIRAIPLLRESKLIRVSDTMIKNT